MSDRWAIILNETGAVSDIKLMDGNAPELNEDASHLYSVEKVGPGVMIDMVRGGPVNPADGFGFPAGYDPGTRAGPGVTRIADASPSRPAPKDPTALPAVSHEKVRVDASAKSAAKAEPAPVKAKEPEPVAHAKRKAS